MNENASTESNPTREEILAAAGEGAEEALLFRLTSNYGSIPAGTLVELCALGDDDLTAFRLVEGVGTLLPMAGYEMETGRVGGWFVYLNAVEPLTASAEDFLANAIAMEESK